MDPFTLFIVSTVLFLVGELIRPLPKTNDRSAIPFEEARLPSTDPQRPVQVGWGRFKISSPHVMGVTEYSTIPLKTTVKTLFKSKSVIIGHRYFVGFYLGTGVGVCNVRKIYHGGELLWDVSTDGFSSQSATDGDVITISKPDFLGGEENGGGLSGTIRFYRGDSSQRVDPYINSFADHQPTPAYRFTSYFVFENFEVGENPNLSEFEFVLDREPTDHLGLNVQFGDQNLRLDGAETDSEVNPMAVAADLLVNTNYGQSEPTTALNISQLKAMGDTLVGEGVGMSLKWVQEESIEKLFKTIVDHIQGVIFKKIGTGQWSGRLIRDDYDPDAIRVLDMSNLKEVRNYGKRNWSQTSNQAIIDWVDRDLDRKPTPAEETNFSHINRIGRIRSDRQSFPGVYSKELATQIAVRSLKSISYPFANGQVVSNRSNYDIEPGEPCKLTWPPLGISSVIIRATNVGYGSSVNGDIDIGFVEDFFAQGVNVFTGLEDSVGSVVSSAPIAVSLFLAIEMPFFLQTLDESISPAVVSSSDAVHKLGFMSSSPQNNALEARIYEEAVDGQSLTAQELSDYTPNGLLTGALLESTADEGVSITIDGVTSPVQLKESAGATEAEIKTLGVGLALLTDGTSEEWLGVTNVTDNSDGTYTLTVARGLIDTLPKAWPDNTRVWFPGVALGVTANTHGAAETISYAIENLSTKGAATISSTQTTTFTNRSGKPYPAGRFRITEDGGSAERYPSGTLASGDITFSWLGRDRTAPDILFQNDTTDSLETGFEYFLSIYDNGTDTLLRDVGRGAAGGVNSENTPLTASSFVWTEAKQNADSLSVTDIRVELRVLGDTSAFASSVFNAEDVSRVFTRTIP